MIGVGFQNEADAERAARATRKVERPEYAKRPDGMLGGLVVRPGDLYSDTDYREAVITWLDAETGTYTDDTKTVLVRGHESASPPAADVPVFCTFHGYKDDYAVYVAAASSQASAATTGHINNFLSDDTFSSRVDGADYQYQRVADIFVNDDLGDDGAWYVVGMGNVSCYNTGLSNYDPPIGKTVTGGLYLTASQWDINSPPADINAFSIGDSNVIQVAHAFRSVGAYAATETYTTGLGDSVTIDLFPQGQKMVGFCAVQNFFYRETSGGTTKPGGTNKIQTSGSYDPDIYTRFTLWAVVDGVTDGGDGCQVGFSAPAFAGSGGLLQNGTVATLVAIRCVKGSPVHPATPPT